MQIGPSLNLSTLPLRNEPRPPLNSETANPQSQTRHENSSPEKVVDVSELIQVAEQGAQEKARFYTMDRDLTLGGQEALSTYLTTSQFSLHGEAAQLVGVDIYV